MIISLIDNPHPDARMIVGEKEKGTDFIKNVPFRRQWFNKTFQRRIRSFKK